MAVSDGRFGVECIINGGKFLNSSHSHGDFYVFFGGGAGTGGIKIKFKRNRETAFPSREAAGSQSNLASQKGLGNDEAMLDSRESPAGAKRHAREESPVPVSDSGEPLEVFPGRGVQISSFPVVIKQKTGRPHSSVFALIAAERAVLSSELLDERTKLSVPSLENISHGQTQVLSTTSPDLANFDQETGSSASGIIEGKGVIKRFKASEHDVERLHVLPMHADWFSVNSVHRMERQVVPEYFTGKSNEHTPKAYMEVRNTIIKKYLENPERALSTTDCQKVVNVDAKILTRILDFLDHWGIINYSATSDPRNNGLSWAGAKAVLQESPSGEIQISPSSLRSVQSLIRIEPPRTKFRPEGVSFSSGRSTGVISDLDCQIQERLSEHRCTSCSRYCSEIFYQSQKEADIIICSECFSDGKPVIGMSIVDFVRMDATKDAGDVDGDSWTDQETLLLLEALETYNENWNEIAEHVGTKSKAQCILHFIRLPMEDGLLDNIEIPDTSLTFHSPDEVMEPGKSSSLASKSSGHSGGFCQASFESDNRIAFANSSNPIMALVAFLASAVGPRVAAACAHAALVVLSKEDSATGIVGDSTCCKEGHIHGDRPISESMLRQDGTHDVASTSIKYKDSEREESQGLQGKNEITSAASTLPPEKIKLASMAGLSAAALKAKLFADQEEREIQRQAAFAVTHQLRRLETKLKQLSEIESKLSSNCEQVETSRQRLSTERIRIMSSRFGSGGSSTLAAGSSAVSAINNRPTSGPAAAHPGYGSSTHPAMPFMTRPAMFPFAAGGVGSPVPLSGMQSLSGGAPGSMMIGPTAANSTVGHSMLRPVNGNNTTAN